MKYNKKIILLLVAVLVGFFSFAAIKNGSGEKERLSKITTNSFNDYISINECWMWLNNNGMSAHDPRNDASGFYWPGGENATIPAIFTDGLIWGAKIGRETRVGGATYRYGLQAGKILPDGTADNANLDKYRIYKVRKNWQSVSNATVKARLKKDMDEWPVEDGAPWVDANEDGIYNTEDGDTPEFIGDEVLWFVSNDMDASKTTYLYGTLPMGMEVQTTIFGFNRTGDLGNMIFKKFLMINKGTKVYNEMHIAHWTDTDLGFASDDFTGCDTTLSLGYTYNGDNNDDNYYGVAPPAVGYDFFQGPMVPYDANDPIIAQYNLPDSAKFLGKWRKGYTNLPMTAFTFYINTAGTIYRDPQLGVPAGSEEMYNYMTGHLWNGDPFVDPNTGLETPIILSGDPVAGTGWYEGPGWSGGPAADDRRHLQVSGPFTMAPGDTQEVVIGVVIARGDNNLDSVTELKRADVAAQIAFNLNFDITDAPPVPTLHGFGSDKGVTLWWETNAESYDEKDPLIFGLGYDDTTYSFEGYKIWQFSDLVGSEKSLLAIYDIENGISQITQETSIAGVIVYPLVFESPDAGLTTMFSIDNDVFEQGDLINGTPYYFGVTSYGYSPHSNPTYLESPVVILEVIPRRTNIDENYKAFSSGNNLSAQLTVGTADAAASIKIIDPTVIQDASYKITFQGEGMEITWNLENSTTGETLLSERADFGSDSLQKSVTEGFITRILNTGKDEILALSLTKKSGIKSIQELINGEVVTEDVFETNNSTNQWKIIGRTEADGIENINARDNVQYSDYEIRFTAAGSEYYTSTFPTGVVDIKDGTKATDRMPLEAWDVVKGVRLVPKIYDIDKNGLWNQIDGNWEPINFLDAPAYAEPLPEKSGITTPDHVFLTNLVIDGELPATGTVVRVNTWKPLLAGMEYNIATQKPKADPEISKTRLNDITVYPNPYFGAHSLEANKYARFVRFLGLPEEATIRIFSLSGVFIRKLEKSDRTDYVDWNLLNDGNIPVASGVYIAYIEMPGIGEKILKIAVIMEKQYIDRI
ncbi:MAG: hypothetical protein V1720_02350 [bacterium]